MRTVVIPRFLKEIGTDYIDLVLLHWRRIVEVAGGFAQTKWISGQV